MRPSLVVSSHWVAKRANQPVGLTVTQLYRKTDLLHERAAGGKLLPGPVAKSGLVQLVVRSLRKVPLLLGKSIYETER